MRVDCLTDKSKSMACLVNCHISPKFITAGFVYFRGGLTGNISVFDDVGKEYKIQVPENVGFCDTEVVRVSSYDDLKVYLAK